MKLREGIIVFALLCCTTFAQSMESYERNQERLRVATFDFIEKYAQTRNDQPRFRVLVRPCLFQYVPERITGLGPDSWCLIPARDVDEIAHAMKLDKVINTFEKEYARFKAKPFSIKYMEVANCLYGCVFADERETIDLQGTTRINESVADEIAAFLKI